MSITLDEEQEKIVNSREPKILVVAGAGSGKTRVLTERVKRLIKNGVEPSNIVCITFTNVAAQEMKDRLSDVPEVGDCFIGTIHSFANSVYKTSGLTYKILNQEVRTDIVKELLNPYITKYSNLTFQTYLCFLDAYVAYDNGKITEEEFSNFLKPSEKNDLEEIDEEIKNICKIRNIISFDQLLEKSKEYYNSIDGKIEYLMVDELQDINNLEFKFIKGLNADNEFYVGDDWQAIYGFSGGNVKIFKSLYKDEKFKTFILENNYRNSQIITDVGLRIIKQSKDIIEKNVVTISKKKGSLKIGAKKNIEKYLDSINNDFKDWFILTRSNREIVILSEVLEKKGIPFTSFKKSEMNYEELQKTMKENKVKLLTVHSAKGLENKNVILFGNFPVVQPKYRRSSEERKVMYVGVTRAKENLIILN